MYFVKKGDVEIFLEFNNDRMKKLNTVGVFTSFFVEFTFSNLGFRNLWAFFLYHRLSERIFCSKPERMQINFNFEERFP